MVYFLTGVSFGWFFTYLYFKDKEIARAELEAYNRLGDVIDKLKVDKYV